MSYLCLSSIKFNFVYWPGHQSFVSLVTFSLPFLVYLAKGSATWQYDLGGCEFVWGRTLSCQLNMNSTHSYEGIFMRKKFPTKFLMVSTYSSEQCMVLDEGELIPRCCATSKMRRGFRPSTSKAFKMGGNFSSNWTSTTAPITAMIFPVDPGFAAGAELEVLGAVAAAAETGLSVET